MSIVIDKDNYNLDYGLFRVSEDLKDIVKSDTKYLTTFVKTLKDCHSKKEKSLKKMLSDNSEDGIHRLKDWMSNYATRNYPTQKKVDHIIDDLNEQLSVLTKATEALLSSKDANYDMLTTSKEFEEKTKLFMSDVKDERSHFNETYVPPYVSIALNFHKDVAELLDKTNKSKAPESSKNIVYIFAYEMAVFLNHYFDYGHNVKTKMIKKYREKLKEVKKASSKKVESSFLRRTLKASLSTNAQLLYDTWEDALFCNYVADGMPNIFKETDKILVELDFKNLDMMKDEQKEEILQKTLEKVDLAKLKQVNKVIKQMRKSLEVFAKEFDVAMKLSKQII